MAAPARAVLRSDGDRVLPGDFWLMSNNDVWNLFHSPTPLVVARFSLLDEAAAMGVPCADPVPTSMCGLVWSGLVRLGVERRA